MSARFALDEDAARAWLAAGVEADYLAGQTADNTLPELTADWFAGTCNSDEIESLLAGARDHGIIAGPAHVSIGLDVDGSEDGYRWLVTVGTDPGQSLILASAYADSDTVGDALSHGVMGALSALVEAVGTANECLDDLDAYVAAEKEARG